MARARVRATTSRAVSSRTSVYIYSYTTLYMNHIGCPHERPSTYTITQPSI